MLESDQGTELYWFNDNRQVFESYKPKCVHNGYSTEMITELIYILESTLDRGER